MIAVSKKNAVALDGSVKQSAPLIEWEKNVLYMMTKTNQLLRKAFALVVEYVQEKMVAHLKQ